MEKFNFYQMKKIHQDAIRSITTFCNPVDGCQKLITVSRDSEAKIFSLDSNGIIDFNAEYTFFLPTQISTVSVLDRQDLPTLVFIFGCLNGHVYVFHGLEQNAFQYITLHSNNVCTIKSDSTQTRVATGSWDHTALVFKVDECGQLSKMLQITGHQESVMDLLFIRSDRLLTASSDRSIVLWDLNTPSVGGIRIHSFQGHEDCVRGLLLAKHDYGFYSISNDQTVRYWNLSTNMSEKIYLGHEHFIFNINHLSKDYFLTCGENNALLVWHEQKTNPWQSLKLPTVTIWSVMATNSNIIYAAGSDGILYIFTNLAKLQPDQQSQSLYQEMLVKQTKIPFASVAHLKLYEENSLSTIPPRTDGDRRLIRSMEDDTILVYEWNQTWKPIGFVPDYHQQDMDQSTGRVPYNDEFFDEVFNVKLNQKNYKLPFNRDQDPWVVAQLFVEQNQLDYGTLPSLVQCIVNYASYKPKKQEQADSFSCNHFPIYEFKLWTQMPNLEAFRKKFEDFNRNVDEDLRLSPEHLQVSINELQNPESYCLEFCDAFEILFKWPTKIKFIVYDLLRVMLTNKYFNTYFLHRMESSWLRTDSDLFNSLVCAGDESNLAGQLTSLRVLANLFGSVHGVEFMFRNFTFIHLNILKWTDLVKNLNVHLAYASIWFNYSVLLVDWKKKQNHQFKRNLMEKISEHGKYVQNQEQTIGNYDKVILEVMNTYGNLTSPSSKFITEESNDYLKILKSYPDRYRNNPDIRYCLRQIEMSFEN